MGEHDAPRETFSTMSGLKEISTLIVSEMLDMLYSSKASGAVMGFLTQSKLSVGIQSLVSITYWLAVVVD